MCACDESPSGVCPRHQGTPHDWLYHLEDGPEQPDEQHERLTQEHQQSVVTPALKERL